VRLRYGKEWLETSLFNLYFSKQISELLDWLMILSSIDIIVYRWIDEKFVCMNLIGTFWF
jgi:hypothetical protein